MPDDKGVFELPGSAGDPDLGEPYEVSIRWDEDGHVTPVVTIPGGDLPSESLPGDYPEPGGDPALAVNDDGTTDSQAGDVFG